MAESNILVEYGSVANRLGLGSDLHYGADTGNLIFAFTIRKSAPLY